MLTIVFPPLMSEIGGGQIVAVEGIDDPTARLLDQTCGTDYLQHCDGGGERLIAGRVQYGNKAWNTTTVRSSLKSGSATEEHKLRRAIREQQIRPHMHVQAYVSGTENHPGKLLAAAAVWTSDLMEMVDAEQCTVRTNPKDGTCFKVVTWDDLEERGAQVTRIGPSAWPLSGNSTARVAA
jgi:hypothetical protein